MTDGSRDTRFMKLGALSFVGNAGAVLLLYALFFWVGATNRFSGVDDVHGFLVRLTTLVPAALIILANLALARQLMLAARRQS